MYGQQQQPAQGHGQGPAPPHQQARTAGGRSPMPGPAQPLMGQAPAPGFAGRGGPPQGYPHPGMQRQPTGSQGAQQVQGRPPFQTGSGPPSRQPSFAPGVGPGGGMMPPQGPGPQRAVSPLGPPGMQNGMRGQVSPAARGPSPLPGQGLQRPGTGPPQGGQPGGGPAYGQQPRPQMGNGLEQDMQRLHMGSPTGQASQGLPPQPSPAISDLAPTKTKRSARAYHQDASPAPPDQFAPPAPAFHSQVGRTSPMPPREPLSPQGEYSMQQQQQQGYVQPHPYQNAPPPGLHPDRPDHLQQPGHQPLPVMPPGPDFEEPNHIPQPPHSAGQRLPGVRSRIDPNQIPSPVHQQELDQTAFDEEPFATCGRGPVPLSSTDFIAVDQGNCNPRFLRMTTYSLPATDEMAAAAQLPLGLVVQPFAELKEEEGDVPVVDFGEPGPPRCSRCRGYINPWCHFVDGGQKFSCNLCGAATEGEWPTDDKCGDHSTEPVEVAAEYFCNLDMSGRRVDHNQRAELCRGSVDFVVPKDYWVQSDSTDPATVPRTPAPISYIFAIDVSWSSVKTGVLTEVLAGIRQVLYGEGEENGHVNGAEEESKGPNPVNRLPKGAKVAIMTFDRTVHFYNLSADLDAAQMLVVPDLDDMFVPMSDGLLADPHESRELIEGLLDNLPNMFAQNEIPDAALGGPVGAALQALKRLGGQLNVFLTSLPKIGPGNLRDREDQKLWGTDKEKTLFAPADPWYRQTAEECALAGIGINLFLFPSQYIDVASVGVLSGLTGGEVFFHPRFTPVRDSDKVRSEIKRVLTRETGYSVTMRIRCSNGLRVAEHFGSFLQRNITDLELGNMDADKAIGAHIKHESKLDDKFDAYVQCALLYTTSTGERRVRCHNLGVPVTSVMGNVFLRADMDTTITFLAKQYIALAVQKTLRDVRTALTEACVRTLVAYRKNCATSMAPGQLILPESYKLFPLFALALMKSKALKGGQVASDVRTHFMRYIKSLGVASTVSLLHPRMLSIHDMPEGVGLPDAHGRVRPPPLLRTSYQRMQPDGMYLIDNGDVSVLWIGMAVSPAVLQDLYGVENADELDVRMSSLPNLPTSLSRQVHGCVAYWERTRGGRQIPVIIARQNKDGTEIEFANMLVEDQNNDAMSYVDYLCAVHKAIQTDLVEGASKEKADAGVDASSFLWRGSW